MTYKPLTTATVPMIWQTHQRQGNSNSTSTSTSNSNSNSKSNNDVADAPAAGDGAPYHVRKEGACGKHAKGHDCSRLLPAGVCRL